MAGLASNDIVQPGELAQLTSLNTFLNPADFRGAPDLGFCLKTLANIPLGDVMGVGWNPNFVSRNLYVRAGSWAFFLNYTQINEVRKSDQLINKCSMFSYVMNDMYELIHI